MRDKRDTTYKKKTKDPVKMTSEIRSSNNRVR